MSKFTPEKLKRLQEIAAKDDQEFSGDLEGTFAFSNSGTFLETERVASSEGLDIALVGVPFDLGVTQRSGARYGPQEVRKMSSMAAGPVHQVLDVNPFELCKVADVGDAPIASLYDLEKGITGIESYYGSIVETGAAPLSVGGDHSVSFPILKALAKDEPLALVHFDAHCDTGGSYLGEKFHHGGPFRNAALAGAIDPEKTIQIGIRGRASILWNFSHESGMTVVHMNEFREMGVQKVIEEIHRVVGDTPCYVTFDVDALDPVYAPGTGTPEVGGITTLEAQEMIRSLGNLHIVGGDVVEVAPPYDQTGGTALVGATMLWEILCVMAQSIASRRS